MRLKSNICVNNGYSLVSKIRAMLEVAANYWIPLSHILDTYTQSCLFNGVVFTVNSKYSDTKRLLNEWKSATLLNNMWKLQPYWCQTNQYEADHSMISQMHRTIEFNTSIINRKENSFALHFSRFCVPTAYPAWLWL